MMFSENMKSNTASMLAIFIAALYIFTYKLNLNLSHFKPYQEKEMYIHTNT